MNRKGIGKLRLTRLLMWTSQLLLVCFVVYWLMGQYKGARQELTKDLTAELNQSIQQSSHKAIKVFLGDFVRQMGPRENWTTAKRVLVHDTMRTILTHAPANGINTRAVERLIDTTQRLIHRMKKTNGPEGQAEGLQVMIKSSFGLPDSLERHLMGTDTTGLLGRFKKRLEKKRWNFPARWVSKGTMPANADVVYVAPPLPEVSQAIQVKRVSGYLLRQMSGSFLFAFILLGLTGTAFWFTYKSLKAQMHLAAIRNDFISNMSHELKTPVATVKVALEALADPEVLRDARTARDYVTIAALETDRLGQLIHMSLQTSLLEEGRLALQREAVDLRALVQETVRILQRDEHTRITVESEGANFTVTGDKLQLQGVLLNLLDNAIKYGGAAQEIRLRLFAAASSVHIGISDQGPGIPEAYRRRVFDKFFRVPTGNEHSVKGYGLGLSYAAQVIRRHGGDIEVHNNPGGGCTFTIQLPTSAA